MTGHDVDDSMGTWAGGEGSPDVEAALRRALTEPVTAAELTGWDTVAAAYRDARSTRRGRRLRLMAGLPLSAAAAAAVLLPAGAVAAAYTGRLPAHVQHWAHRAFAPIGVPSHRRSPPLEPQQHRAQSPSPSWHADHRPAAAALPAAEHERVVELCVVLSRSPRQQQQHLLTALHRLLPRDHDLHLTCRALLLEPRARHHAPIRPARPSPSPSQRPSAAPASAKPASVPTPTPSARPSSVR